MIGYWPSDPEQTMEQRLKNVQDALTSHDDSYATQTLNNNPVLLSFLDENGDTLLSFVNKNGCSKAMKEFVERKSAENKSKLRT